MLYNQPYGISDPNAPYINGNPSTGTMGSIPPAAAIEYPQREIANLITAAGITPSNADLQQAARAIQSGKLTYGLDSGAANAYSINLTPALASYYDGLSVWIIPANSNTGPSTININGLGVVSIVHRGGGALVAGDMPAAYKSLLVYNVLHGNFELYGIGAGFDPTTISSVSPICVGFMVRVTAVLTTAATSITFTAAEIAVATPVTTGQTGTILSSYSQVLNLTTTGAGGMDFGSAPVSSYVYIYAIYNPATHVSSILATTGSSTIIYSGTHLPAGYTMSCLLAVWPTNSSGQMVAGAFVDGIFTYVNIPTVLANGNATTSTAVNIAAWVPPVARSAFVLLAAIETSAVTGTSNSQVANVNVTNAAIVIVAASILGATVYNQGEVPLSVAQTIYYNVGHSSVTTTIDVSGYRI